MEYAADGIFEDRPTFNAINRNLPEPIYTTAVTSDDYREIHTSALVLRYKRNSGPFMPSNTSVQLTAGAQQVTARPAFPPRAGPSCAFGVWCEAEKGTLSGGVSVATNHGNYTGTGFVDKFEQVGDSVRVQIGDVPAAGTYTLSVRYANDRGAGGQVVTRTLSAQVGGQTVGQFSMEPTRNWDTWHTVNMNVTLAAGTNTIAVTRTSADSGAVNIDSIAIAPQGAGQSPSNLKSYRRALDTFSGPAVMADGLLARDGWYLPQRQQADHGHGQRCGSGIDALRRGLELRHSHPHAHRPDGLDPDLQQDGGALHHWPQWRLRPDHRPER